MLEWSRSRPFGDRALIRMDPMEEDDSKPKSNSKIDYSSQVEPAYLESLGDEADLRLRAAHQRNVKRIRLANEADEEIIGKYLPANIEYFFPCQWSGPVDDIAGDDDWLEEVIQVASSECPIPDAPLFDFETTEEAMHHNSKILEQHNFDLEAALEAQRGTTVWHGSEFRKTNQLEKIIGSHPHFDYLKKVFEGGMDYEFLTEVTDDERKEELQAQLDRGNHKSAIEESERISELLKKDVKHGFCLPLPVELVNKIKGAMVQPCGIVSQFTLTSSGERTKKKRLTHDLTFSLSGEERSVNKRIDMSKYPEMVYGWCLLRVIHFIVALRHQHPQQPIYISKFDYSDAYRRISHTAAAAAMTILAVGSAAFLMLRLAFGGSPNPPCFCAFSETLTDLANELSASKYMPRMFRSPTVQPHHLEPKSYVEEEERFGEAILPAVEVPLTATARKDAFIDDIVSIFLGTKENLSREGDIVPLAVHVLSRPHAGDENEPIPRRQLLQPDKLEAEGRPSESEIVLGWLLDARRLMVGLPDDKYKAWSNDLEEVIESGQVEFSQLESLIGRLNHASFVIPLSRHFLNELRWRLENRNSMKRQNFRLSTGELEDLKLWRIFLTQANRGISMNLLSIRTPTLLAWSDSCPHGLGGYLLQGRAWRLRIPKDASFYGCDEANNVLEFLGMGVNILLLLHENPKASYPCILALGDNTSGIGWIFRSSKVSRNSVYYSAVKMIARKLASAVLQSQAQLTAQHLPGLFNDVADLLSFSGKARGYTNPLTADEPSNQELTQRLHSYLPQLIPENFEILPLPNDIRSFATTVLQTLESSWIRNKKEVGKKSTDLGGGGSTSSGTLGLWTRTSMEYPQTPSSSSPKHSSLDIASLTSTSRVQLLRCVRGPWYQRLSKLPLAMWLRRSGQITAKVPSTTKGRA